VPLPEQIAVTYSEEDAQYLTVRPVRRQAFRPSELVDMILTVTGKDSERVRHILRTGTLVYHFYRYRWDGIELDENETAVLLAGFPDADPARKFDPDDCTAVLAIPRSGQGLSAASAMIPANAVEFLRDETRPRRILRARSLWEALMETSRSSVASYAGYSYERHADVFQKQLNEAEAAELSLAAVKLAPRSLRARAENLAHAARLLYVCPRK
jgi:hypothetical protein